jgi:hypothetical protein
MDDVIFNCIRLMFVLWGGGGYKAASLSVFKVHVYPRSHGWTILITKVHYSSQYVLVQCYFFNAANENRPCWLKTYSDQSETQ